MTTKSIVLAEITYLTTEISGPRVRSCHLGVCEGSNALLSATCLSVQSLAPSQVPVAWTWWDAAIPP